MNPALHGLLLAAGASSRFGGIKQLAHFRGESLLRRAAVAMTEVLGTRTLVVLGANADRLRAELDGLDLSSVINADWRRGKGSSLSAGIAALPPDCGAVLVMLCDQPFVGADVLRRLVEVWEREPHRLVVSGYEKTLGVPAILPRAFFREIGELSGEDGAKRLLYRHEGEVVRVPAPEAAVDIDTAADLTAHNR